MSNTWFAFKQFTIYHNKCAMKVGTDGVLLGAWSDLSGCRRILDAGTGTGLIAIMIAQRCVAQIDAVEIDPSAAEQAAQNAAQCPWHDRIRIYNRSLQDFAKESPGKYDLIISNPPYYRNSLKPAIAERKTARHDDQLNYESLFFYASGLLSEHGRIAVIFPFSENDRFSQIALLYGFYPIRQTMVKAYPDKDFSRCLVNYQRHNAHCRVDELIVRKGTGKEYTDQYKALTDGYYLKFPV